MAASSPAPEPIGAAATEENVEESGTAGSTPEKQSSTSIKQIQLISSGVQVFSEYFSTQDKSCAIFGGIGIGAMFGVLARVGLGTLFAPYMAPSGAVGRSGEVVKEIVANMVGCFVMGLAVELRPRVQPQHPMFYASLTTGFCGCCTTFSSYNTAVALILLRSESPGDGILCAHIAIVLGACTAWCALQAGRFFARQPAPQVTQQVGDAYDRVAATLATPGSKRTDAAAALASITEAVADLQAHAPTLIETLPEEPAKWVRPKMIFYWVVLAMFAVLVICLVAVSNRNASKLLVSVATAPFGAWLRYKLAVRNQYHPVPLYTLLCNLTAALGSVALNFALDVDCGPSPREGSQWLDSLAGVSTGFCGSLSTVSTFVDEVRRLGARHRKRAVCYAFATVFGGELLAVALLAPLYAHYQCWSS